MNDTTKRRRRYTILSLLLAAVLAGCQAVPPDGARSKEGLDWNVVLVTFDTTRADFLGAYGRENARTHNLDRLASEGFLFEHNLSSNPVTQPAHSTILTGVYPMVHGVRDNSLFKLSDQRPTLAGVLRDAGWATGAAIGGFPLVREFGLAQGFDFYDDDITGNREDFRGRPGRRQGRTWYDERPAAEVNDAILPWLREHIDERFFVWLHYWDPHHPHGAPAPYGELYSHNPYQGEIAYADDSLGTILRELKTSGVYDRTIIIMTSDHGEGNREHNELTHAFLAYDSTLHVPLIIKVPGMAGGHRIQQRVGTVDIVPTVLDLVGVTGPDDLQGRSLALLMREPARVDDPPRQYYSESLSPRLSFGIGELRVLYDGTSKYIHGPRPELFDLALDPRELHDLSSERPEERARLEATLARFIGEHASARAADAAHEVDKETRRRLEALGYLDSGGEGAQAIDETLRSDGAPPQDRVGDINLATRLRRQLGQGEFSAARATAERLLEGAPQNVFFRVVLARALVGLEKPLEAATVVEETERLNGSQQAELLSVAKAVFDAGEQKRGRVLAGKIVAAEDTAAGRVVLATMAREAGDVDDFVTELERALELDDDIASARSQLAMHLLDTGDLDGAERELRELFERHPLEVQAHIGWARLLRERGEHEAALARIDRALNLAPTQCDGRVEKLRILVDLERAAEAKKVSREIGRACRADRWLAEARAIMGEN
ncbi:MAG: sulfatase-like hydrolase/transferase [Deltaproteobacteria bacterium]|nr:sulfatase-like hydrolase/transferase [Deltaproteobacteria bacterium]